MKIINLNQQYQLYLQRVGLDEERMHPIQRKQLKQTFFGASGQMLILLRDEVCVLDEHEAVFQIENLLKQVTDFFLSETNQTQ